MRAAQRGEVNSPLIYADEAHHLSLNIYTKAVLTFIFIYLRAAPFLLVFCAAIDLSKKKAAVWALSRLWRRGQNKRRPLFAHYFNVSTQRARVPTTAQHVVYAACNVSCSRDALSL